MSVHMCIDTGSDFPVVLIAANPARAIKSVTVNNEKHLSANPWCRGVEEGFKGCLVRVLYLSPWPVCVFLIGWLAACGWTLRMRPFHNKWPTVCIRTTGIAIGSQQ